MRTPQDPRTILQAPHLRLPALWIRTALRLIGVTFRRSIRSRTAGLQWVVLLAASLVFVVALELLRIPAAFLLGPMLAGIAIATSEGTIAVPAGPALVAQAVIGCLIARSMPVAVIADMIRQWPLLLAGPVPVIAASTLLGFLLARWRVLPGTVAVWGSSPGGALAMTLIAEAHGADVRLVALMQYLRMASVAFVASVVARLWGAHAGPAPAMMVFFPAIAWGPFVETLAIAVLGAFVARWLRVRGGQLLLPLAAGVALQRWAGVRIELPPWLLATCYAVIGWSIGLRFTRPLVADAIRVLPRVVLSIGALIAACGVVGAALSVATGVDPLTAYLATSPGGADSIAIIAASSNVDVQLVMAMQTARFVVVILTGPTVARYVANRIGAQPIA